MQVHCRVLFAEDWLYQKEAWANKGSCGQIACEKFDHRGKQRENYGEERNITGKFDGCEVRRGINEVFNVLREKLGYHWLDYERWADSEERIRGAVGSMIMQEHFIW